MRNYILLACLISTFLLAGCSGRLETVTAHQVVNDIVLHESLGYFQISQTRWVSDRSQWNMNCRSIDRSGGSDIVVEFHSTCSKPISFNFLLSGHGWSLRDAVVNLEPNQVYTSQRIDAIYNALDYWRVNVTDATYAPQHEKPFK